MALSSNRFTGKFFALLSLLSLTDSHYDTVTIIVVKQWDIYIFRQFGHISMSASSSYLRFDSVSTRDQSSVGIAAIASKYPDHPNASSLQGCRFEKNAPRGHRPINELYFRFCFSLRESKPDENIHIY